MLLVNDFFLLENNVYEISIAHKLTIYLDNFFKNFDMEYNKTDFEEEPKKLDELLSMISELDDINSNQRLGVLIEKLYKKPSLNNQDIEKLKKIKGLYKKAIKKPEKSSIIRPDIIIHKRGDKKNNLLAIEIKKEHKPELAFSI